MTIYTVVSQMYANKRIVWPAIVAGSSSTLLGWRFVGSPFDKGNTTR